MMATSITPGVSVGRGVFVGSGVDVNSGVGVMLGVVVNVGVDVKDGVNVHSGVYVGLSNSATAKFVSGVLVAAGSLTFFTMDASAEDLLTDQAANASTTQASPTNRMG